MKSKYTKYISVHTWTWTWKSIKIPSLSVHSIPLKSCESFASTRRRAAPHGPPWPWSRPRRHGTTRLLLCPVQGHGVMGSWGHGVMVHHGTVFTRVLWMWVCFGEESSWKSESSGCVSWSSSMSCLCHHCQQAPQQF